MTQSNKILIAIIAILCVIVVIMGFSLEGTRENYTLQKQVIQEAKRKIKRFEAKGDSLQVLIDGQMMSLDSLRRVKSSVIYVTISEIDSVKALLFDGKGYYFVQNIEKLKRKQQEWKQEN